MSECIVSLRDKKAESFQGVCQTRNLACAERMFRDLTIEKGPIAAHKEDYQLWLLGRIDLDTGMIDVKDCPLMVIDGGQL